MAQTNSVADPFASTLDAVSNQASACAMLTWIPALLFFLNRLDASRGAGGPWQWISAQIFTLVSPLDLPFRWAGVEGGVVHDKVVGLATILVTAMVVYLPCLALGLLIVGLTHTVRAAVRGSNR